MFKPWSSTQQTCSPLCERLYKVEKRVKREEAQERKAVIAKAAGTQTEKEQVILQDRDKLEKELTRTSHRLVKLRDWGLPCISCGEVHKPDFQAGHYHSRGAHIQIGHDMLNINGQCYDCNIHKGGNKQGYRQGIKARYGSEVLQKLVNLSKTTPPRLSNWEIQQLIRQRKEQSANLESSIKESELC
jgi:hypothetical protein